MDPEQGIPLMDLSSRHDLNDTRVRSNSVERILQPDLSNESKKSVITDAGWNELHQDLQKNFTLLKEELHQSPKAERRLQGQIEACAHAIDTLEQLLPKKKEIVYWKSDDWYTKEPLGGVRVRKWLHRTDTRIND